MKTNTELTRAFEAGEINFTEYMTTAAEPDARRPVSHYRKSGGKRAAARQGAILEPLSVPGTPAEVNATVARANRVEAVYPERVDDPAWRDVPEAAQQAPLADEGGAYVAAPGNLRTAEAALKFLLAGNAYFTVRSLKTGVRYTFRVALAPVKENCTWCRRTPCTCKRPYFVSFLSGPENTSDYTYLGMVTDSVFRVTRASQRFSDSTVFKAFDYVFRHLVRRELPPQTEIWHEGKCGVCGRALTVPESIESGIGPVCAGKGGM